MNGDSRTLHEPYHKNVLFREEINLCCVHCTQVCRDFEAFRRNWTSSVTTSPTSTLSGLKGARVMFQDVLSQTVAGATGPADDGEEQTQGEIGLGTTTGSIDVLHTPGSWMTTNVPTDLAIEGEGFFVVTDGNQNYLTRRGTFYINAGAI